jgi:hypothetical protein
LQNLKPRVGAGILTKAKLIAVISQATVLKTSFLSFLKLLGNIKNIIY